MTTAVPKWEEPSTDLSAVSATGAGDGIFSGSASHMRFVLKATGTVSATVKVQGSDDGGTTWSDVSTSALDAVGDTPIVVDAASLWPLMRTNVSLYSSGTFTTTIARRR